MQTLFPNQLYKNRNSGSPSIRDIWKKAVLDGTRLFELLQTIKPINIRRIRKEHHSPDCTRTKNLHRDSLRILDVNKLPSLIDLPPQPAEIEIRCGRPTIQCVSGHTPQSVCELDRCLHIIAPNGKNRRRDPLVEYLQNGIETLLFPVFSQLDLKEKLLSVLK